MIDLPAGYALSLAAKGRVAVVFCDGEIARKVQLAAVPIPGRLRLFRSQAAETAIVSTPFTAEKGEAVVVLVLDHADALALSQGKARDPEAPEGARARRRPWGTCEHGFIGACASCDGSGQIPGPA